ncbi:hypothetical protein [Candidatus Albibeggiatoa sp. nov. NOAA]|uniref:SEL1-like repeat protein n=1 Tax=Candidatus Albibeggiatoa sp. nov. NOAA TaxID=3162724 RepID=UPI0032F42A35|nr:hypothetical protein [Thiotrichaceae bacterium]
MPSEKIEFLSTELKSLQYKAQQGEDACWFDLGCCLHIYAQQYEAAQAYERAFQYYYVAGQYWLRAVQSGIKQAEPHLYHAYLCNQGIDIENEIVSNTIEHISPPSDTIQHQFFYACQLWLDHEQAPAINLLENIAQQGYSKAQFFMYQIYKEGVYREKNVDLALNWLHKAAWRNDIQAQYVLGQEYHAKNNYEASLNWLLKAMGQKDSENYNYKAEQQLMQYAEQQPQIVDLLEKKANEADAQAIQFLAHLYKQAKIHLENMMALFAHKLRAPLQHIEYNVKNKNNPQQTLHDVESMQRFLNIYSFISSDGQQLKQKLQQDMRGAGRLTHVLERSFIDAITPLLSSGNRIKIKQHYLHYAKQNQLIPQDTKLRQWDNEYLYIGQQLQIAWSETFFNLIEVPPQLSQIQKWFNSYFFPIQFQGFDIENIQFNRFSVTEEVLVALLSEMLLNMVKYYHAIDDRTAHLSWHCEQNMCTLKAINPTSAFEQKLDKGSKKGQDSLLSIVRKMGGDFQTSYQAESYQVMLTIPATLLIDKE